MCPGDGTQGAVPAEQNLDEPRGGGSVVDAGHGGGEGRREGERKKNYRIEVDNIYTNK